MINDSGWSELDDEQTEECYVIQQFTWHAMMYGTSTFFSRVLYKRMFRITKVGLELPN
jgi:hypothetical protein